MKWQKLREAKSELENMGDTLSWEQLINWGTKLKPRIKEFFPQHLLDFDELINEPQWIRKSRYINRDDLNSKNKLEEENKNQKIVLQKRDKLLSFLDGLLNLQDDRSNKTLSGVDNIPVQSCINCHFLIESFRSEGDGSEYKNVLNERKRKLIKVKDYEFIQEDTSLACWRGIWDEGYNFPQEKRHEIIVETDRKGQCFFYSYTPRMLLDAAKELQERSSKENIKDGEKEMQRNKTIDLTFIINNNLKKYLYSLYEEHQKCLDSKYWKAAVFTAGFVLEGILLDRLLNEYQTTPSKIPLAKNRKGDIEVCEGMPDDIKLKNIKKIMLEWSLGIYIRYARSSNSGIDTIRVLQSLHDYLLDYRNTLHPGVYINKNVLIGEDDANILSSAIHLTSKHFSIHGRKVDRFIKIIDFSVNNSAWNPHPISGKPEVKYTDNAVVITRLNQEGDGGIHKEFSNIGSIGEKIIVGVKISSLIEKSQFQLWLNYANGDASKGEVHKITKEPKIIYREMVLNETCSVRVHLNLVGVSSVFVEHVIVGTCV